MTLSAVCVGATLLARWGCVWTPAVALTQAHTSPTRTKPSDTKAPPLAAAAAAAAADSCRAAVPRTQPERARAAGAWVEGQQQQGREGREPKAIRVRAGTPCKVAGPCMRHAIARHMHSQCKLRADGGGGTTMRARHVPPTRGSRKRRPACCPFS